MKQIFILSMVLFWSISSIGQIRIKSVDPTTDEIQLNNYGNELVDISGWRLCSELIYTQNLTSGITIIDGSLQLAAGDSVTITGFALTDEAADLGIYLAQGSFTDTAALVDFVQWGAPGIGREPVADAKGIWQAGEFIAGNPPYTYIGNGTQNGLAFWEATPAGSPNVRFLAIDPMTDEISLKNFGTAAIDVSDWRLCTELIYNGGLTNSVSIVNGSFMMEPGDTLVVTGFAMTDSAADMGIYLPEGRFSDPEALVDFVQWGAAGIGREAVADAKGIWQAGDFIVGNPPFSYTGDGTQNGLTFWEAASVGTANVRFLAIDPTTDEISLKNFGTAAIDVSDWRLCTELIYNGGLTNSVSIVNGSFMMEPGDTLVVTGFAMTDSAADMGIYLPEGRFSDPEALVDFVQWGAAGIGREAVADAKGIWQAGDFIVGNPPFSYTGDGTQNGLTFWEAASVGTPNVRFLAIDPTTDEISLKNFGTAAIDVSDWRLCTELIYNGGLTNSVSIVNGSFMMEPGDTLVVTGFAMTDSAADMGIYLPEGRFSDPEALVDFVQWGAAGIGREAVADAKGIWQAGDFIVGNPPFSYTGDGTQNGLTFWEAASIGTANVRFLAIDPTTDEISLKNFGTAAIDVSDWRLCTELIYNGGLTNSVSIVNGSFMMEPGDTLVVTGFAMTDSAADMGIYLPEGRFSDPEALVDFVQWGAAGIGREAVADAKGIWQAGDFLVGPGPYRYVGNGTDNGFAFWQTTTSNRNDLLANDYLRVYPNRFNASTNIRLEVPSAISSQGLQLGIYDIRGILVKNIPVTSSRMIMNRDSLNDGMYFMRLQSKSGVISVKRILLTP